LRTKAWISLIENITLLFSQDEQTPEYKKVLREVQRRVRQRPKKKARKPSIQRHSLKYSSYDIFERTGLFEDDFVDLKRKLFNLVGVHKKHILDEGMQLLLVLHFLRENLKFKTVGDMYSISPATTKREIHFLLPKVLAIVKDNIGFPLSFDGLYSVFGTVGDIDGTCHLRNRVHPGSLDYYRGDIKDYFLNSQLIVSHEGELWNVTLKNGHHNDQGVFNISGTRDKLLELNIKLLGDNGYHSAYILTPREMPNEEQSLFHRRTRAIVERVIGFAKCWAFASGRCRLSPELQRIGLMIIYELVASIIRQFPLHPYHKRLEL